MHELEIAHDFQRWINEKGFSEQIVGALLEKDFFSLEDEQKSTYLYDLFNGLMLYDIKPEVIVCLYRQLMKLDSYKRENVAKLNFPGKIVLECTGSGKKPFKTLNISTPSIITAVASGAYIIKKGSGSTSSIIGSSDLLYGLGLKGRMSNEDTKDLLQATGFTFIDIEKVIPVFNSFYNGYFYKPHILSYILAADVTSLRGDKIVYGLSGSDVMKCCKCLSSNKSCSDIVVYCSTENEAEYYDELIGGGICYMAKKVSDDKQLTLSQYRLNLPSPRLLPAALTRKESINAIVELFKFHKNESYCKVVSYNAGLYLLEAGIVNDIEEGQDIAMASILSGQAYKKLIEIIKCSGGRPTWNE